MKPNKRPVTWNIILIIFVCLNLANINASRFDGDPPPETEVVEETVTPDENDPLVESNSSDSEEADEATSDEVVLTEDQVATEEVSTEESLPIGETPTAEVNTIENSPTEEESDSKDTVSEDETVAEMLSDVPENTDIVVLDENGEAVSLVEQEAADIMMEEDPMWCPVGVLPGGVGCSANYANISALILNMRNNTSAYEADGVIYFTANSGGSLELTNNFSSLRNAGFNALSSYNLTLQGGWNGVNGAGATFTGQTNFGSNTLTIGEFNNRWIGDITLNNFTFNGVSNGNAITIYTTSGDITLNNVDVAQQSGNDYTANLDSNSGDITVQNSSFDGNNSGNNRNRGFRAQTDTGAITITDASFSDARDCFGFFGFCFFDAFANNDGATLSAPTVTLTNVTSNNNDLNGIQISDADTVTLNNVTGTNNGTSFFFTGVGSGVNVNGTGSTTVNVTGGTLSDNQNFGLSVFNGTINVYTHPTCINNGDPGPDPSGCYNILPTVIVPPPVVVTPPPAVTPTSGREKRSNYAITGEIPVTGGSLFDISCIDPAINTLTPPGAKITFINLCGYQAVLDEVLETGLPETLPNGVSFINGVTITVLQDNEQINPLPADASILLGLPTPANAEGEFAILYWDGGKWTELDTQNSGDGFAEVVSTLTGTFVLVAK